MTEKISKVCVFSILNYQLHIFMMSVQHLTLIAELLLKDFEMLFTLT